MGIEPYDYGEQMGRSNKSMLDIDDLSISCGICANAFLCRAPVVVVGGD